MPRQIDPKIAEILKGYGADPTTSCWDCHGTWVVYHKTLEMVAAKAGIAFENPIIIEADTEKKIAVISVNGHTETMSAWSVGEAAPYNNKNAYPWAMAEKRAKDRVILKLLGLSGLVYSEDEADDFKEARPPPTPSKPGVSKVKAELHDLVSEFYACGDGDTLLALINTPAVKKFAFRVCCDYPSEWIGPEPDSGFAGCLASAAEVLGVMGDAKAWAAKVEKAALEKEKKQAL